MFDAKRLCLVPELRQQLARLHQYNRDLHNNYHDNYRSHYDYFNNKHDSHHNFPQNNNHNWYNREFHKNDYKNYENHYDSFSLIYKDKNNTNIYDYINHETDSNHNIPQNIDPNRFENINLDNHIEHLYLLDIFNSYVFIDNDP
ncbi:Oidioi.mRNA.OKI2018_I69.PAR.g9039.t1.cds [Oikopleura dioica]|uniref:Oidioi.mRNA.OKI2018_I69.PAR.g9039.t1.cds n=1 Tax=Oikopleura dioica TaxID=34765 RepID=A0ABN7RIQ4_OIKDI|nr:Oidioi.mRNA.OKI2018_I69.PAR.g9039.t1.cds [Oikopleura dioica]